MSVITKMEQTHIDELAGTMVVEGADAEAVKKTFKDRAEAFNIGDLVKVGVKIIEGKRERVQIFEGYVIAFRGHGITRTFKVRKIAFGVGVERTFPMYSPKISSIELVRRGKIRRPE